MAVYLHVLSGLNYDRILTMADVHIWYVLCMPIYTYLYTAYSYIHMYMCIYYSSCIAIMSNICDRTDTCTCTSYFMAKCMGLCIVCVVV